MTSHSPATDLSQDQPSLPNQHFSSWLRGQTTLFVSQIIAVLGIILFIAEEIYYVAHASEQGKLLDPQTVKLIVDYAHIAFITVFIVVLIKVLDDNDRGSYRVKLVYARVFKEPKGDEKSVNEILETSKDQLRKFKRRFLWFWIGMLFLYVAFALQHNYQARHKVRNEPASKEVTLSFDGKIHGEQKFKGELSLNVTDEAHGVTPGNHAGDDEKPDLKVVHVNLIFASITFIFNNLTLLSVFLCFLVMFIKPDEVKKERKYVAGACAVVGSLIVLFLWFLVSKWGTFMKDTAGTYASVFDALSGVINAVVLALLIARLDSKLVGLPPWLISILYSYAAVQPLFLVFELGHSELLATITTLVLIFVFMSKIYFFLIIFYALQTGKMLNYLTCFPILRKRAGVPRGLAAQRKSVFVQLAELGLSALRKPAEGYRRVRRWRALRRKRRTRLERAQALKTAREAHPQRIRDRLGLIVSVFLKRYSIPASEVIGWVAILYFFCAIISSQVLPETPHWGGGLWSDIVFVLRPPLSTAFGINVVHLVFLALMIVTLCLILEGNQFDRKTAAATARRIFNDQSEHEDLITEGKKQIKRFKKYFLYFWCVTFLLYAVFLFEPLIDLSGYKGSSWSPVIDPSGCEGPLWPLGVLGGHEEGTFGRMVQELLFPTLGFVFASLNLMYAYRCFVVLRSPAIDKSPGVTLEDPEMMHKHLEAKNKRLEARQKLLINYSTFGVYLLIAVYLLLLGFLSSGVATIGTLTETLRDYATMFDGVTGLLSAIVLALLIARMDSKLFSLPSRLIWLLFVYASIQSLYIIFAQTDPVLEMVREAVLHTALGLKICFFLIVAHSLQSGRMLNYLVSFPLLKERVDSIFENQFEIRLARVEDNEFTFLILKKNRLHYSAAETFESREKCDLAVEELRTLMKKSKPYGAPRHSAGTYWVEVRSGNKLLCESISLRSAEEALDLIDESMGKVPYCKYNRL
jgi:cell division protein FtsL